MVIVIMMVMIIITIFINVITIFINVIVDEDGDNDQDDSDDDDDGDNQVWRRSLPSGASSHQGWTLPSPLLGLQQLRVIAITFFLQKVSTKVFHQQFSTKKISTHLSFAHFHFPAEISPKFRLDPNIF